jgi:hypothetical protein
MPVMSPVTSVRSLSHGCSWLSKLTEQHLAQQEGGVVGEEGVGVVEAEAEVGVGGQQEACRR